MENLKINWGKDTLNYLKRANEEVNDEKFINFRGKYKPKLWIIEYKPKYGDETWFRVPNSIVWNSVNRKCDDSTLEFIKNEIISLNTIIFIHKDNWRSVCLCLIRSH